jgi:hypothetical protein
MAMTHVDEAIRRALSPEDARAYDALGRDLSPIQEALDAFRSQHRMFAVFSWVGGVAMFVVTVYAAWRFWNEPNLRLMLVWAGVSGFSMFSLGLIKLWFWMEMQKNSVVRELKRLELQVASLIAITAPR